MQFTKERLRPALEYIDMFWNKLERYSPHDSGTLVGLPEPYFVPSVHGEAGFAFEEMYYWDSYFIALGLVGTSREDRIRGLADNLVALLRRFEVIPTAGRFYMTSRSQPPFLTSLIMEAYRIQSDRVWLEQAMSVAKSEYWTVWMGERHPNWRRVFEGLSRFYDINMLDDLSEAESGWDYTTRFERRALSFIPVDLNALLYRYEKDFEETARILNKAGEAAEWAERAEARRRTMQKYLWDEQKGCYFDYNYVTSRLSPVYSLAAFYPMWVGMESAENAERLMSHLDKFEFEGGLTATAAKPHVESSVPTQWAYPNGWAPLQIIVIQAMERYGYHDVAERLARKWISANLLQFEATGKFFEKYNVVEIHAPSIEGVYPAQSGFGWTNAAFSYFCHQYLRPDELPKIHSVAPARLALKKML